MISVIRDGFSNVNGMKKWDVFIEGESLRQIGIKFIIKRRKPS